MDGAAYLLSLRYKMKAVRQVRIPIKRCWPLLLLISLLMTTGCRSSSPSQEETPSLEETFTWMQLTLAAHNGLRLQRPNPKVVIVAQFTHHGCQIEHQSVKGDWATHIDLTQVDPNSIKIEKIDNVPWVTFQGRNSQKVVQYRDPLGKLPPYDTENGGFTLDSQEYAERFLNALKHAVILCGGKPSTF